MPADACPSCGATGQQGAFCDDCGAPLPGAESVPEQIAALDADLPEEGLGDTAPLDTAPLPPDDVRSRARQLIVPVAGPVRAERPEQPAPVLPGVPEPAVPAVRGFGEGDLATGPPCPWCSTPNPPGRHFCRHCAMPLASGPAPLRLPWWRRMLGWYQSRWGRRRELPYAGQRPRLRRGADRLERWLVFAVVIGLVAGAADIWAGAAVTNVKDHFAHRFQVFPTSITASRSDPAHPASNLRDSFNNTFWGTGEAGDGAGVYVDAAFNQPVNLLDLIITGGAGVAQDAFTAQSRPESVKVTLLSAGGGSTSTTITLADSPGPQTFGIQGNGIVRIRFTLESAYLAQPAPGTEVAIAELEFFASSGGG